MKTQTGGLVDYPPWYVDRDREWDAYLEDAGARPTDVSPFGVRDLAGNVRQWCSDWYDPTYYQTSALDDLNPSGPPEPVPHSARAEERAIRGNAFYRFADPLWTRQSSRPHWSDVGLGFRLARSLRLDGCSLPSASPRTETLEELFSQI